MHNIKVEVRKTWNTGVEEEEINSTMTNKYANDWLNSG